MSPVAQELIDRNDEIRRLRAKHQTYERIGEQYGICKERVRQICKGKTTPKRLDPASKSMLRPGEAAEFLGIHVNTVRRWSDRGVLVSHRISRRGDRRFKREDLNKFLDSALISFILF